MQSFYLLFRMSCRYVGSLLQKNDMEYVSQIYQVKSRYGRQKTEVEIIWKTIVEMKKGNGLGKVVFGKYDSRCLNYVYFGWLFQ